MNLLDYDYLVKMNTAFTSVSFNLTYEEILNFTGHQIYDILKGYSDFNLPLFSIDIKDINRISFCYHTGYNMFVCYMNYGFVNREVRGKQEMRYDANLTVREVVQRTMVDAGDYVRE